jgi:hypothetical protein
MKSAFIFLAILGLFSLSSCIEIIDDISVNKDGSGTFKYTINLSSSKLKINSILALDSLNGTKVPSIDEIQAKIDDFKHTLTSKLGISNVTIDCNYTDYVFKLDCDFTQVSVLQDAFKQVVAEFSEGKYIAELDHNWILWDDQKLVRSIPTISPAKSSGLKQEDIDRLKEGNYISISRFDRLIDNYDNPMASISKNKLAVMLKTNMYSLLQNTGSLENTIYLSPIQVQK